MSQGGQLITKYRPQTFDQLIGHTHIPDNLKRAVGNPNHPHNFLLTGPSGVGKTTIARIIAGELNAEVMEIDAASNSSVDAMRQLVDLGMHVPLSGNGRRMVIIDECHVLSKTAWQALLKILEEPPPHLYFALCTTEANKVPATIENRCYPVKLGTVEASEIRALLQFVAADMEWEVPSWALNKITSEAAGSPRQALNLLQAVQGVSDEDEFNRIISLINKDSIRELCQLLVAKKRDWPQAQKILQDLIANEEESFDFDAALRMVRGYLSTVVLMAKTEGDAQHAYNILEAFMYPVNCYEPKPIFVAGFSRAMFGS